MKIRNALLLYCCDFVSPFFEVEHDQDPSKVEFFERIYRIEIKEVKPLEEYQDPGTFYSEVTKK